MKRPIVWSEAALRLFDLTGPTAVSAGAGSGKTTCLVELCVRLLSGEATGTPCEPAEMAAITFTEKAAAELEQRLRAAVVERARAERSAGAPEAEARRWRGLVHRLDAMAIGTIHGFAGRLLREHALEAGLDPEFEVLDEDAAHAWLREAARAAVVAALDAGRPEVQVLAAAHGAGGRRAGLADLVAEVARDRSTHGDVQPIRPSPDATTAALEARAQALAAAEALLGLRGAARTASGARALDLLADAMGRIAPADRGGPPSDEALERIAALADAVRGWRPGASPDGARETRRELLRACEAFSPSAAEALAGPQKRELCALVEDAEARYRERKRRGRALDFDDLLVGARDLLRRDPALRSELRARLRTLLVDEYQDVNAVQEEIFQLLADDRAGEPGPWLVAVGDLKQSIYRFRGADVAVFRGVLERFGRFEGRAIARVLHLARNHRSGAGVLDLVNEVFSRCMQPAGGAPRPYEIAFREEDRLEPVRAGGQRPSCEILEDGEGGGAQARRAREARAIAARIQALVSGVAGVEVRDEGADGSGERPRRPRPGDVAVLFRRLTQIGEYERALREAGIPYRLARGGGFYQAPEVRDLGELLASLFDPQDALAWAAILRSPFCGLGEGALFAVSRSGLSKLARREPGEVVAEMVRVYPAAAEPWRHSSSTEADRLRRFLAEWRRLHAVRDRLSLPALLSQAVDELDLEAAHLASSDGLRRVANVRKALAMAARFAEAGGSTRAFADRLRTMAARPPREPEGELEAVEAVALLSVHQAKGLEWPIVFVPDLGALPPRDARRAVRGADGALAAAWYDSASGAQHVTASLEAAREEARRAGAAEARRLLYVALTRARDRLVLSGDASRGAETWRALVEDGLQGHPELAVRIPYRDAATFAVGPVVEPCAATAGDPPIADAGPPVALVPEAPPDDATRPAVAACVSAVRLAVTELAEHARCPRRVFLARRLGLAERPARAEPDEDDPERATARGTLAHAMLAELDLAAPPLERRAQLAAAASRRGHDPHARGVRRIVREVTRFLESPPGRRLADLARRGTLRREVPFLLRLDGDRPPSCYLVGALDALVQDGDEVIVIDFKYAMPRPGGAERYRFQMLAYALAASRARPGSRVKATLQFLRGSCAAVDLTPSEDELRRFAAAAPRLAERAWSGADLHSSPADLGRTEERCRAEGCGFVHRCHAREVRQGSTRALKGEA